MRHRRMRGAEPSLAEDGCPQRGSEIAPGASSEAARFSRLLALARPHRWRFAAAAAAGVLWSASGTGLLMTSAYLISRAAQHPPILSLTVAIVGVRFFALGRGVARYTERLLTHDAGFRLLADLRVDVFRALTRLVPGSPAVGHSGDLLGRVVRDIDTLHEMYVRVLVPPVVAILGATLAVTVTAWLLPIAAIVLAGFLGFGVLVVPWTLDRLARQARAEVVQLRARLLSGIVEFVQGVPDLLAFGAVDAAVEELLATEIALAERQRRLTSLSAAATAVLTTASGAAVVAMLLVGVPAVRSGQLEGVLLAPLVLAALAAFEPVLPLVAVVEGARAVGAAARRVFALLDAPAAVVDPRDPAPLPHGHEVHLDEVSVRYGEDSPWILRRADLRLAEGERVALVGPSGVGKTTLANLLVRFRDVDAGAVTLGGIDVRRLAQRDLRRVVGLVGEDAHLFAATIRQNLLLARPSATEDELRAAAARACILEWIESLPAGWDTEVGELGARLSGGQRRRLALARGYLADFPVLIVDEPLAHLDDATAAQVVQRLLDGPKDRTLLLVTHAARGIERCDRVLAVEARRIVPAMVS